MTTIPEKDIQFAKDLAELCRNHKLLYFNGDYFPSVESNWHHRIVFAWKNGRHGAESDTIKLHSEEDVTVIIEQPIKTITGKENNE